MATFGYCESLHFLSAISYTSKTLLETLGYLQFFNEKFLKLLNHLIRDGVREVLTGTLNHDGRGRTTCLFKLTTRIITKRCSKWRTSLCGVGLYGGKRLDNNANAKSMGKIGKANFAVYPRVLSPFFPKINLYIRPLIKKKRKQKHLPFPLTPTL